MSTQLIEKIRDALRISSQSEKITNEIKDCINACMRDLAQVGIKNIKEDDPLVIRAITIYCKAEFGYHEKAQQFKQSYEDLKVALSLRGEYKGE